MPKPLEELLEVDPYNHPPSAQQVEMARRLRRLDERHQKQDHAGIPEGECKGCLYTWPCPDRRLLDGEGGEECHHGDTTPDDPSDPCPECEKEEAQR